MKIFATPIRQNAEYVTPPKTHGSCTKYDSIQFLLIQVCRRLLHAPFSFLQFSRIVWYHQLSINSQQKKKVKSLHGKKRLSSAIERCSDQLQNAIMALVVHQPLPHCILQPLPHCIGRYKCQQPDCEFRAGLLGWETSHVAAMRLMISADLTVSWQKNPLTVYFP